MNFNVTPEITRNDAETFIPITCQENAGMTGPIHAIVWLMLNEPSKAEREFNRSLQACTYGEFNVRNEVCIFDVKYIIKLIYSSRLIFMQISLEDMDLSKKTIEYIHFFNHSILSSSTHFLTGDGGFIQSIMMGYAGLRYDEQSLLFNPLPGVLTPATKNIRLRNLLVRGMYPFDYTIDQFALHFICSDTYENLLCITDNRDQEWKITSNQLTLNFHDIHLPIRVDLCA
jgi:hypothetical protein